MGKPVMVILAVVLIILYLTGCAVSDQTPPPSAATATPAPTQTNIPTTPTPTQIPKVLLPVRGLYVQFDRRGWDSGYWSGDVIHAFNLMDDMLGHTVKEEVASQLDQMASMGVNYFTFELRSSTTGGEPGPFVPPVCYISPSLGIQYPQPTAEELTNLVAFLDLVHSKGMKVALRLVNIHQDKEYQSQNEQWLGPILTAIQGHPALDLVLFEGSPYLIDTDGDLVKESCGVPAEPPLFAGAGQPAAVYIAWAMGYAHNLGYPWKQLSAEAMVGHYFWWSQAPNPFMTDGHFWDPIVILKGIFDDLQIPDNERTYAISLYEYHKCTDTYYQPCEENLNRHAWTIETVQSMFGVIGRENGARVVAVEMSLASPVESEWTSEMALQSLVWIMQAYGIEGGSLWRWTNFLGYEELDPTLQTPVRKRGVANVYTPVKDVLQDLYTRGQANDLSLTPEEDPPVFASVAVSSNVIKNGEPMVITANLGETHLFVSADISELDPGRRSPILFRQVSDGVYEQTIILDHWNLTPNGTKTITISAMDFWSNTAADVLMVTLDNPLPVLDTQPPNDDFNGKTIDTQKWLAGDSGGATVSQDAQLVFVTNDRQAYSSGNVISNWFFEGDFDVQVEFQLGKGWDMPATEHIDGAFMGAVIAGQEYFINRLRNQAEDKLFSWSTTGELNASMNSPALAGRYRMVRSGTTLTFLFDLGNAWQVLASTTVPDNPAQIRLGNGSIGASMGLSTYFDNFHINSGVTTYRP